METCCWQQSNPLPGQARTYWRLYPLITDLCSACFPTVNPPHNSCGFSEIAPAGPQRVSLSLAAGCGDQVVFVPSPWHTGCLVVRELWGCLYGVWDWLGPHQLMQQDPRMWVLPTDGRVQGDLSAFPVLHGQDLLSHPTSLLRTEMWVFGGIWD